MNVNDYRRPQVTRIRQVPLRKRTCATTSTTVAEDPCNGTVKFDYLRVYRYFHYRRENDYFHDDPVNNYFHFERVPPRMHASKV